MENKNKVKAVVFDMDGVIFDSERQCLEAWKVIGAREGLEGIEDVCKSCIGTATPETIRLFKQAYGEDTDVEGLHNELRRTLHEMRAKSGLPVKCGAAELLRELFEHGVPLAIASSTRFVTVKAELETAGFADYFSVIVGGDMVGKSKPEPDIYLEACRRLGVNPQDCAAIEDSFNGIRSAHAAGMTTIMVPDIVKPDDEILRIADFKCDNLFGARDVLAELM